MSVARIGLWLVTLVALALCVRAWWIDVVPGVLLVSGLGLVTLVAGLGVANPGWEMFGVVLDRLGDPSAGIVLCLECSGDAPWPELLDLLDEADARVTFVVRAVEPKDAELVRQATGRAHDVALGPSPAMLGLALVSVWAVVQRLKRLQLELLQVAGGRSRCVWVPSRLALPGLLQGISRSGLLPVTATRGGRNLLAAKPAQPGEVAFVRLPRAPDEARQSLLALRLWLLEARTAGHRLITLEEALRRPAA